MHGLNTKNIARMLCVQMIVPRKPVLLRTTDVHPVNKSSLQFCEV